MIRQLSTALCVGRWQGGVGQAMWKGSFLFWEFSPGEGERKREPQWSVFLQRQQYFVSGAGLSFQGGRLWAQIQRVWPEMNPLRKCSMMQGFSQIAQGAMSPSVMPPFRSQKAELGVSAFG